MDGRAAAGHRRVAALVVLTYASLSRCLRDTGPDRAGCHPASRPPASTSDVTATITFPATSRRFVRVDITANTGWPAGQLSSLEVYAS
jgi:hypothetical protein